MHQTSMRGAFSSGWVRPTIRGFATVMTVVMMVVTWGPLRRWLNYTPAPRRATVLDARLGEWVELSDLYLECAESTNVEGPTRVVLAYQGRRPFLLGSYRFRCVDAPSAMIGTMERLSPGAIEALRRAAPGLLAAGGDQYFCASCGPEDDAGSVFAGGVLLVISALLAGLVTRPETWRRWSK